MFSPTSYLTPPTSELSNNARFGSSVECLGDTDRNTSVYGYPRKKVIVGAPYYDGNGAVFVYRYRQNRLELSQTIKSPGKEV